MVRGPPPLGIVKKNNRAVKIDLGVFKIDLGLLKIDRGVYKIDLGPDLMVRMLFSDSSNGSSRRA